MKQQPETNIVQFEKPPHTYFHQMLNMAEDDLDPFEYRLLAHYIRKSGHGASYPEAIRVTAKCCKMSIGKVRAARQSLVAQKYIDLQEPTAAEQQAGQAAVVTILDRWAENVARYGGVQKTAHGGVPNSAQGGVQKTAPLKELKTEELKDKDKSIATAEADASRSTVNGVVENTEDDFDPFKAELETVTTPDAPIQEPLQSSAKVSPPRKLTPHQAMYQALCDAMGLTVDDVRLSGQNGEYGRVASKLVKAEFLVDDVPALRAYVLEKAKREKWSAEPTVHILGKLFPNYRASKVKAVPRSEPDKPQPPQIYRTSNEIFKRRAG